MSTRLNVNYKISERTLDTLSGMIRRIGFSAALDLALDRSWDILNSDPESIIITEYLSWSVNLTESARQAIDPLHKNRCMEASNFYRRLAHRLYWDARKLDIVPYNPFFLQSVE